MMSRKSDLLDEVVASPHHLDQRSIRGRDLLIESRRPT
jgi:hypothetical protein